MPIRAAGPDRAASAIPWRTSALKRLGLPAPHAQGCHEVASTPPPLKRWTRTRTHWEERPHTAATSALRTPPREGRTTRALRALTALAFWRLGRRGFFFS